MQFTVGSRFHSRRYVLNFHREAQRCPDILYTPERFAERASVVICGLLSVRRVKQMITTGELPVVRHGHRKLIPAGALLGLFDTFSDLDALLLPGAQDCDQQNGW